MLQQVNIVRVCFEHLPHDVERAIVLLKDGQSDRVVTLGMEPGSGILRSQACSDTVVVSGAFCVAAGRCYAT